MRLLTVLLVALGAGGRSLVTVDQTPFTPVRITAKRPEPRRRGSCDSVNAVILRTCAPMDGPHCESGKLLTPGRAPCSNPKGRTNWTALRIGGTATMRARKPGFTQARLVIGTVLAIALVAACGSADEQPDARAPYSFTNGTYQLTTFALEGDCKADWVASPGSEYVGKIVPVEATTSQFGVALSVCGHDDAVAACGGFENAYEFGMAREGDSLVGAKPIWIVPGCGCTEFDGTATVSGEITGDDAARLTWNLTITAPDPECVCSGYHVCSGTIEQRLSQ